MHISLVHTTISSQLRNKNTNNKYSYLNIPNTIFSIQTQAKQGLDLACGTMERHQSRKFTKDLESQYALDH